MSDYRTVGLLDSRIKGLTPYKSFIDTIHEIHPDVHSIDDGLSIVTSFGTVGIK